MLNGRTPMIAAVALGFLAVQDDYRESDALIAWGRDTAAKLATFVPPNADGMVDGLPWDIPPATGFVQTNSGCPAGCSLYVRALAAREWRIADDNLVRNVEAAEKAELDAAMKGQPFTVTSDDLKRSERIVALEIQANGDTGARRGSERAPSRVTIAGRPALRFQSHDDYDPPIDEVRYEVTLGDAAFKNAKAPASTQRAEARNIVIWARVTSRPDHIAADDALVRQLMEKIDYAGLEKLLQRDARREARE